MDIKLMIFIPFEKKIIVESIESIDVNNNCTLSENSANCELIGYSNIDDRNCNWIYKLVFTDNKFNLIS